MAILELLRFGICVSDLSRSLRFYCDLLGFQEISRVTFSGEPAATLVGVEELKLTCVFLERDSARIELLWYASPGHLGEAKPRHMNELGISHMAIGVDDLEATVEMLERGGARVLRETQIHNPELGGTYIFVTDPDGTRIELLEETGQAGS